MKAALIATFVVSSAAAIAVVSAQTTAPPVVEGFKVRVKDVPDPELDALKTRSSIPDQAQSCHTALVGGYAIEGHVPAAEVKRLLAERPAIAGIAVPGMPIGSPGMEVPGRPAQPYRVIAFDTKGATSVFATYDR